MELIRAGLGDDVDVTAGEAAIFHVDRRDLNRNLLRNVERERKALGRIAVIVKAEVVVLADAVNGQRVEAFVRTNAANAALKRFVDRDPRVEADDVFDVAVKDRQLR